MKKFFKTLLVALLLIPACAWADGWNDAEYQRIEQSIQLPNIKQATKKYVISAYGAKQNASAAQNQKAINKLIAAIVTASVALLLMNFSRSGRTVDESRAWLKRICITWAILNGLGFIMAYVTPLFSGGQWTG